MRQLGITCCLLVLILVHTVALRNAAREYAALPARDGDMIVLPSPFLRVSALEFKGLVADFLFLDAIIFYGGTMDRPERPRLKEWEWRWLEQALSASTDLDPYFLDPYYFGNATFTWEAEKAREANKLLDKGIKARYWDWMLPFFAGFNAFYFMDDFGKASEYIMESSRRPGASPLLGSLASKLAYQGSRTETSIQFLEETIRRMEDGNIKQRLNARLDVLKTVYQLELAVTRFKKQYHRFPRYLGELVSSKMITQVPVDPYGGRYVIDREGKIHASREEQLTPIIKKKPRS